MRINRRHPKLDELLGKEVIAWMKDGRMLEGVLTFESFLETGKVGDRGHYYINGENGFRKSSIDRIRYKYENTWVNIR